MNIFKKLFSWNRKERDETIEQISKRLGLVEKELQELKEVKKIYRSRIRLGNNTIIVLNSGETITCDDPENKFYDHCSTASSEEDIKWYYKNLLNVEDKIEEELVEKDLLILRNNPDFIISGKLVYLKGISIPIPEPIVAEIVVNREEHLTKSEFPEKNKEDLEKLEDYYNRYIMFWAKLANSPVKGRNDVMTFLLKNDVRISPLGNIIAYRSVVKWEDEDQINTELQDFVNEEYYKIVKKWKKKASDYNVYDDNGYISVKSDKQNHGYNKFVGNLADLKNESSKKKSLPLYTSQHNKGKYLFTIPTIYKIKSDEIDVDASNCHSGGLHAASVNYHYGGYGDTPVVVLINPAKCIFVTPTYEVQKFRVSEMYIACINPNEHGVHIDESLIEEADRVYNDMTIEELKQAFDSTSMETLSIQENIPETSLVDVKNIVEILSKRIVNL